MPKHLCSSIAERRGHFISLKLPILHSGASPLSPTGSNLAFGDLETDQKVFHDKISIADTLGCTNSLEQKLHFGQEESLNSTSENLEIVQIDNLWNSDKSIHGLTGSTGT